MHIPRIFFLLMYFLSACTGMPLQPLSQHALNTLQQAAAAATPHKPDNALRAHTTGPRAKTRRGPKPKPLEERRYHPRAPIKRIRHSRSKEEKMRVLMFLTHHRVPDNKFPNNFRRPTQREAAAYFKVPKSDVGDWWKRRDEIVHQMSGRSYRLENLFWFCKWPELEEKLFDLFLTERTRGRLIRRGWFRRNALRIFKELYGDHISNLFVFSIGWFCGFVRRFGIVSRAVTKQSSRVPDEYQRLIINWLRYNRRISHLPGFFHHERLLAVPISRFPLSRILNMDETPIPFEYLDGRSYDFVGARTVSGKTDRSGWDKRQATLILYIFADGIPRLKPKIIFHARTGNSVREKEGHLYHPGVTVEFNKTAYNNETLFCKWITDELAPALNQEKEKNSQASLLVLDSAGFHKTPMVLDVLRSHSIIPSVIPGGCTGLVQPLDTAVNKPFKEYLRNHTDEYYDTAGSAIEKWSVSDKRVMVTHVVATAWKAFCEEKAELVQKAFREVGISLPLDGSCDHEIKIKGFPGLNIGNYNEELPVPAAYQEGQSYRPLPEDGEHAQNGDDQFLFEWRAEDWFRTEGRS